MTFHIDPDAKGKIELKRNFDGHGNAYFIGKLQMPMTLEFDEGVSFMVFISDDGCEELQIAPLDPSKSRGRISELTMTRGRLSVHLHKMFDKHGKPYYVGEASGMTSMKLRDGIFFTIFTSRDGEEELQISKLTHKAATRSSYDRKKEVQVEVSSRRIWPPRISDTVS